MLLKCKKKLERAFQREIEKHREEMIFMKCPRCGSTMSGGVCDSCGFPVTKWNGLRTDEYSAQRFVKWISIDNESDD